MKRAGALFCAAAVFAAIAAQPAAADPGASASKGKKLLQTGLYKGQTSQGQPLNFLVSKASSQRCQEIPQPARHPEGRFCFIPANEAKIDESCSTGFTFSNYVLALYTSVLTPQGRLTKVSRSYSPPDPRPVGISKLSLTVTGSGRASGYIEQSSELAIPADPGHPALCDSGKVSFSAKIS